MLTYNSILIKSPNLSADDKQYCMNEMEKSI